ncbi:MAG TPA: methyltransferase domain-containing protein [Candidatus Eisenbacteria bacterium]|nr:methyltransferase domain-containing protein [Candidatus Eisenbacteria bacterium]
MPLIFSYGTLQQEHVQLETFGRLLRGRRDDLVGFEPGLVPIEDPRVAAAMGRTHHANAVYNGRGESRVTGTAFEVTEAELALADEYERTASYVRVAATLASGSEAWVYVDARTAPKADRGSDDRWLAGDAYEAYMGRWSRPMAEVFVEWLRPAPSGDWLEIGCGTGALTTVLRRRAEPASIVACDPSEPFIAHARETFQDPRVTFVVAGVDALPRRDGGFDGVVSGLVLNFLPEPERALASMRERLRPGGVAAAYVWDYAEGMEFLRRFWDEAVAADPRAAALDESRRFPLCTPRALASLFESAGLSRVETAALEIPTKFAGFEDYWTSFLRGTGPAPSYVASLGPPARDALRERLRRRLLAGGDGYLHLKARAYAVRAVSE